MSTRIREFRKLRGMTLHSLAQKVGTTAQTIQRLETNNMTVSLDWLERIAGVFGIPAAALLVTDKTAGVPVLGDLDSAGAVTLAAASGSPAAMLSLVVATPHPVAVRTTHAMTSLAPGNSFEAGTLLIGGRTEIDTTMSMDPTDCLVAFQDGRIVLRRLSIDGGAVIIDAAHRKGSGDESAPTVDWIAPIVMAVRYI